MFFRFNKNKQKEGKKIYKRSGRFGPVYVDNRNKTISLREEKWRFEFTRSDIFSLLGKGTYRVAMIGIFAVSVAVITFSQISSAKSVQFYAGSCLGGWENPSFAQGAPDVLPGSDAWYDFSNSAINYNRNADIFCGAFNGDVPDDTIVGTAVLSFSMYVGDIEETDGGIVARRLPLDIDIVEDAVVISEEVTDPVIEPIDPVEAEAPVVIPTDESVEGDIPTDNSLEQAEGEDIVNTGDTEVEETVVGDSVVNPTEGVTEEMTILEGDDFLSQVGAILNAADGEVVSFTLNEDVAGDEEEVVVVTSGDDFSGSASDILDAPEGANVIVTDDEEVNIVVVENDLLDSLYDILDAPGGSGVQMVFPDDPPVAETVLEETEEVIIEDSVPENISEEILEDDSVVKEETTSWIKQLWYSFVGHDQIVFATTTPSGETTVPEEPLEDIEDEEQEDEILVEDPVVSEEPDTPSDEVVSDETVETEADDGDGNVVQEVTVETIEEGDLDTSASEEQDTTTPDIADPLVLDSSTATSGETILDSVTATSGDVVIDDAVVTSGDSVVDSSVATSGESAFDTDVEDVVSEDVDHLMSVEYTFNGEDWLFLGTISANNWKNLSFELPVISWEDISKVQVRLKKSLSIDEQPAILLDAMILEIKYSDDKKEKGSIEPLSDKKSFKPGDDLTFNFKYRSAKKGLVGEVVEQLASALNFDKDFMVACTTLIDASGHRENVEHTVVMGADDTWAINVHSKKRVMRPGKYIIEVSIEDGGETLIERQDFYWGVLTINTNKSIFEPNEEAYLQMGVLDDIGHTICDAKLELVIRDPDGVDTILATADGSISYSGVCNGDTVVELPDYFAHYTVGNAGVYGMRLTNLDTEYEVMDEFEVRNYVQFIVERVGPTRIYPPATYEMQIIITANQDFTGDIYEYMPDSFEIVEVTQNIFSNSPSPTLSVPQELPLTVEDEFIVEDTLSPEVTEEEPPVVESEITEEIVEPVVDVPQEASIINTSIEYVGSSAADEAQTQELFWQGAMNTGDVATITYVFDAPDISPELFLLGPMEFYE